MRWNRGVALMAGLAVGAAPVPAERFVAGDALIPVTVDGVPLHLRIEPGVPGLPLVTQAVANRLGWKPAMLGFGVAYAVGRERIYGNTKVRKLGFGSATPEKRRVGWMVRTYPMTADGTIGPGGLPEPVIRFSLHAVRPGERTVALPMVGGTGLFGDWFVIGATITVGGAPMVIRFDPHHPLSLASAPAGLRIAEANGGTLTDRTARQEIAFGVERPLRIMTLARPIAIGPLAIASLGIRITDGAGANAIREEGADPAEVVVTGKSKRSPGTLSLGADQLDRCSSIVFDKPARVVRLSCL